MHLSTTPEISSFCFPSFHRPICATEIFLASRRYGTDDQSTSATMAVVEDGAHPVATARRLRVSGPNLYAEGNEDIPANFDAREAFSQCASIIGRVRDQSDCGSCWAFASTEAFNDRRCIAGLGEDGGEASADQLVMLSAEDTTACCYGFSCGLRFVRRA